MLTPTRKGVIAEMAIAAEAVKLDLGVLKPLGEGERYDLVLDLRPRLLRVQCKWAQKKGDVVSIHTGTCRRVRGGYKRTTYSADEVDALAAYCAALERCYLLPISVIAGQNLIHLRLAPARNNQRALVNWAHEYELGAIAQLGERRHGMAEVVGSSPTSSTSEATAPAVASLFEDPDQPPGDSSRPLRPSWRLPIIRAKCVPYCSSGASS